MRSTFKRGGCDTFAKWRSLKSEHVIKYSCKKGMPPKVIHEDFMKSLGMESPFYGTVKKWAAEFKRGEEC